MTFDLVTTITLGFGQSQNDCLFPSELIYYQIVLKIILLFAFKIMSSKPNLDLELNLLV